jgi:4-methyl-5(b-hydroxyethyl)-thiazole monophosphate biosynthesis
MQSQLDANHVSNERVVAHGKCVTAQGPAVAIEFALKLVEILYGQAKAKEVGEAMLVAG